MKKSKILLVGVVLIAAVLVNLSPSFSNTAPFADNCGEGCQTGYWCGYANRDYSKNMVSTLCPDETHHEAKCKLGSGCCCLVLCERDCPPEA